MADGCLRFWNAFSWNPYLSRFFLTPNLRGILRNVLLGRVAYNLRPFVTFRLSRITLNDIFALFFVFRPAIGYVICDVMGMVRCLAVRFIYRLPFTRTISVAVERCVTFLNFFNMSDVFELNVTVFGESLFTLLFLC